MLCAVVKWKGVLVLIRPNDVIVVSLLLLLLSGAIVIVIVKLKRWLVLIRPIMVLLECLYYCYCYWVPLSLLL